MRFNVLGPLEVRRDGEPVALGGPQQRRLLALLIAERGHPIGADRLVEVLWPDDDVPDGAARSVLTYVSRLRAALGPGAIITSGGGYRLDDSTSTCDADDFERLVAEAARALPDRAEQLYEEALALWRGSPFGEFTAEWWALPLATRLEELATVARERYAATLMVLGEADRAIPDLERLILLHPHRERPVALLMQALHATGRQAEALRSFQCFRLRLAEETGLPPSPELIELESSIAAGSRTDRSTAAVLRGYVIHGTIGEGSFGRVYEATQPGTERLVAIKAIRPDLADSTSFIRRFESEARLVARLEHPHIVPLYDYWREPGGAYLVLRRLAGGSVRNSIVTGGPWSLQRVDRLVEEIGSALIYAHAAGVHHNDVRSSNVLLDDEGAAYLTDFGIAVAGGSGTGIDEATAGSDTRSLAWLIWGLLAGEPEPACGTGERAPPLIGRREGLPDGVDAVLGHATDPAGGFGSTAELVLAWRAALGHTDETRRPLNSTERAGVDSLRRAAARQLEQAVAAGQNPYRGLSAFDDVDERVFFGRATAIAELDELVARSRFVTVVGASGSGKSSLVRAGLVPRLRERDTLVVIMAPGENPVRQLDDALGQVSTQLTDRATPSDDTTSERVAAIATATGHALTIVVDQTEELWTTASSADRDDFIAELARIADHGHAQVVATIRADMLGYALQDPVIGQQVGSATFVVRPLTPGELGEAIVMPATTVGVTVAEAVVAQLVAEAASHPGSLPMLQFTMTELYDRRVDARIDTDALDSIGGLGGAIARRAESALAEVGESRLGAVRELFGRLAIPGVDGPTTRRRARLGELSPDARAVADVFVDARLLVTDRDELTREPTVEISHEALLVRWPRLVEWIEADHQWLRLLQQLSSAALAWDEQGRHDGDLFRGARLEASIEAVVTEGRPTTPLELAFVEAGRLARDAELRDAHERTRWLRRLLGATAVALAIGLAAGVVAIMQRTDAQRSAVAALAAERAGRIEGLIGRAESLRATQRDVAALLAVEAHRLDDNARTRSALFGTFTDTPGLVATHRLERSHPDQGTLRVEGSADPTRGTNPLIGIVLPDGATAFVLDDDGRVRPFDLAAGSEGDPWPAMAEQIDPRRAVLISSPDGRRLAQLGWVERDGAPVGVVSVADVSTRQWLFEPIVLDRAHASATFAEDGETLYVTLDPDGELVAFDAMTGRRLGGVPGLAAVDGTRRIGGGVAPVAGGRVAIGDVAGRVRVVDGATFEVVDELSVRPETTISLRPANGGRSLIGTGPAGLVKIDLDPIGVAWSRIDGANTCPSLAVFDGPGLVFCGDHYGRLVARDVTTGALHERLDPQRGNVGSIWPADGQREVVTFGNNEPVVVRWRLDGGGAIVRTLAPGWWAGEISPETTKIILAPAPAEGEPADGTMSGAKIVDLVTGGDLADLTGFAVGTWVTDTQISIGLPDARGLTPMALSVVDGTMSPAGPHIAGVPEVFESSTGKQAGVLMTRGGPRSTIDIRLEGGAPGARFSIDGFPHVAVSRTGHRVVLGYESRLAFHDGISGELIDTMETDSLRRPFITVSDQLYLASRSGELTRYDLETLEPIRTYGASRGVVLSVHGTIDGSLIAVQGGDRFVSLHDVETGVALGDPLLIDDHDADRFISLSIDGTTLAFGGSRVSGAQVWDLRPERWRQAACEIAGRNLTREEWDSHIGDLAPYRATCAQFPLLP